jgi:hypothetical protein
MSRKIAETPRVAKVWLRSGKTPIKRAAPLRERDGALRLEEKIFSPFPNCKAVENRPTFSPDPPAKPNSLCLVPAPPLMDNLLELHSQSEAERYPRPVS